MENGYMNRDIKFRPAQVADLPALNTISIESKKHWGYTESWIERWMDDLTLDEKKLSNQNILTARDEDQVIGFCSIVENDENYEILHLWVLPQYIGKGNGRKLLQATIDSFVNKELPIIVESDPNAESFYKSQGFATYSKVESFPPGRFLPVMRKEPSSFPA